MAKVLCVLYEDPVDGHPSSYARDAIPRIEGYHDGQTAPTPERIDFEPGELLGSVSVELGLRRFLEDGGHEFVVTSDKDGPDSRELARLPAVGERLGRKACAPVLVRLHQQLLPVVGALRGDQDLGHENIVNDRLDLWAN